MKSTTRHSSAFTDRHIGIGQGQLTDMLKRIGSDSLEQLVDETVPESIRRKENLTIGGGLPEHVFLRELLATANMNKQFKTFIGMGYYSTIVPTVIARNVFENPGWYTAYTPYQSEIAQGRLEALLNFQTMVTDLTGMEIANSSLLDEATAAAEAMAMMHRVRKHDRMSAEKFFVADHCFPQTIDVLKTRATPLGIELVIGDITSFDFGGNYFGLLIQYPDQFGNCRDYTDMISRAHNNGILVAATADLLSLTMLKPPGEMGVDIVCGSAQRFGVPKGYGGPHAAYFSTREEYKRNVPGRIIGVSVDRNGQPAYRMALQTREQHIRREKATSNICTAQVLLANMASMYGVYHGPEGLRRIGTEVHRLASILAARLEPLGVTQLNDVFFDTLWLELPAGSSSNQISEIALRQEVNLHYLDDSHLSIALDETTDEADVETLVAIFKEALGTSANEPETDAKSPIPASLARTSAFMTHEVFNSYHTETKMLRYIKSLENKDLSLTHSMIPLGSCTMKLNATSELIPVSWPAFASLHPYVPTEQALGYKKIIEELGQWLCDITDFHSVSFQPNSGAQGEYAGMLVIQAYHHSRNDHQRNVTLIPASAHGTNPASAVMAGMKVVIVKCDQHGNIDVDDLRQKAIEHRETLSALMVTYPSTHGVFESSIKEVCDIIHENGGQVYMDGANMNAQVGLTSPGLIGADVCHLNLHKTFSIPHGGGGPGMGPIGVAKHLTPFLPGHVFSNNDENNSIGAVSAAHFGSASILLISHAYIRMLGTQGLVDSTRYAILNANYIKARLEEHIPVLYTAKNGRVGHELIFDCRPFKQSSGVEVEDIAKRLMDYGFHAPTVSFPVPGTIMVEPTESESLDELDRFCEAMISICAEIKEIESGEADHADNVLKNAPHTAAEVTADEWIHSYTRTKAAYPLPYLRISKFWPPVARIDNAQGDRNLICTCPPIEAYE